MKDTLQVTIEDMVHHVAAVGRAKPAALVVGDLPWMSYHTGTEDAVKNAASLVRAGAQAVKLEGGQKRIEAIQAIVDAEVPVMGHLGLTPQSVHALGGYKVQGKQLEAAQELLEDARALEEAGCFAGGFWSVCPDGLARAITEALSIPTIGIGAGRHTDGQVLVYHDILGFSDRVPKFVRQYADVKSTSVDALSEFVADVRAGTFPSSQETYHMTDEMAVGLDLYGEREVQDKESEPA